MSNITWFKTTGDNQPAIAASAHGYAIGMSACTDTLVLARTRGTDVVVVTTFPGSHAWSPPI